MEEDREEAEKGFSKLFNRDIHLAGYEEVRKPDVVYVSGKASYIERNQVMIDDSDICIVYYDETYTPKQRQISHKALVVFGQVQIAEPPLPINTPIEKEGRL